MKPSTRGAAAGARGAGAGAGDEEDAVVGFCVVPDIAGFDALPAGVRCAPAALVARLAAGFEGDLEAAMGACSLGDVMAGGMAEAAAPEAGPPRTMSSSWCHKSLKPTCR